MFSVSKIGAAACDNDEIQLSTGFTHKDDWQGKAEPLHLKLEFKMHLTSQPHRCEL